MPERETVTSQTDILLQIAQTLATVQGQAAQGADVGRALEAMTKTLAELATRTRPENPEANGISAYSYPEGDHRHPKEPLKCAMFWVGYPLTIETLTPAEVEVLNRLRPGASRVTKGNGEQIPFTVEGKYKQDGSLSELWVQFPCKGDQSTDHRSLIDYCREASGEAMPTVAGLQVELARLQATLAAAQTISA